MKNFKDKLGKVEIPGNLLAVLIIITLIFFAVLAIFTDIDKTIISIFKNTLRSLRFR